MISLHILKLLEDNNFGTIDVDLFYEKLTLDKTGLYIVSRGTPLTRSTRKTQAFDIYARGSNDVWGANKLDDVLTFLENAYGTVCDLPSVPPISTKQYTNVAITPTSAIENVGLDAENRIIYVLSGIITYDKGE